MKHCFWSAERSRHIVRRLLVEGDLVLQTPACLGNGDAEDQVDMPLLVDALEQERPLLTGASLAGALRSFLREWEHGYGKPAAPDSLTVKLFGGNPGDPDGVQSALIVEDVLGSDQGVERRQEVGLDPRSRTSAGDRLFDRELWTAGTRFPLRLELLIEEEADASALRQALATALHGLEQGAIALGARKSRGYGRCLVTEWRVREFDLARPESFLDWIAEGDRPLESSSVTRGATACEALQVGSLPADRRHRFCLLATFEVDGSLLMGGESSADGPDKRHVHSARPGFAAPPPVMTGTGLAGALRARAQAIATTLSVSQERADVLVDMLFGPRTIRRGGSAWASPLRVAEVVIDEGCDDWVQFRTRLDRWTAGVLPGALFNAQPVSGGILVMALELRQPTPPAIGLLLLLLKDLWQGDLALGSELGSGRGRLIGREARLDLIEGDTTPRRWTFQRLALDGLGVSGDEWQILEDYVGRHLIQWFEQDSAEAATDDR